MSTGEIVAIALSGAVFIAFCIWWYGKYRFVVGEAGPFVPPGYVAHGGKYDRVAHEGEQYIPKYYRLIEVKAQVTDLNSFEGTPGENLKRFKTLVTWKPDLKNLQNFDSAEKVHAELKRLYATLPNLDLPHYAKVLGIEIVRVEDNQKPSKITGVSVGEGVEIPY